MKRLLEQPAPLTRKFTFNLDESIAAALAEHSARHGAPVGEIVRRALRSFLGLEVVDLRRSWTEAHGRENGAPVLEQNVTYKKLD